jgi:hypothetical protein
MTMPMGSDLASKFNATLFHSGLSTERNPPDIQMLVSTLKEQTFACPGAGDIKQPQLRSRAKLAWITHQAFGPAL